MIFYFWFRRKKSQSKHVNLETMNKSQNIQKDLSLL
jgi:hypothetical protein